MEQDTAFVVNFHSHDLPKRSQLHLLARYELITYAQVVRINKTCQTSASQSDLRLSLSVNPPYGRYPPLSLSLCTSLSMRIHNLSPQAHAILVGNTHSYRLTKVPSAGQTISQPVEWEKGSRVWRGEEVEKGLATGSLC